MRVELLPVEITRHEVFVRLDDRVEELLAVLLHDVGHLLGNRLRPTLAASGGIPVAVTPGPGLNGFGDFNGVQSPTGDFLDRQVVNGTLYFYRMVCESADGMASDYVESAGAAPSEDPYPPEAGMNINNGARGTDRRHDVFPGACDRGRIRDVHQHRRQVFTGLPAKRIVQTLCAV